MVFPTLLALARIGSMSVLLPGRFSISAARFRNPRYYGQHMDNGVRRFRGGRFLFFDCYELWNNRFLWLCGQMDSGVLLTSALVLIVSRRIIYSRFWNPTRKLPDFVKLAMWTFCPVSFFCRFWQVCFLELPHCGALPERKNKCPKMGHLNLPDGFINRPALF